MFNSMVVILQIRVKFLVFLALCVSLATTNCPLHGCTRTCSYNSAAQFASTDKQPVLVWKSDDVELSTAGCVTNGARIVCPLASSDKSSLMSWNMADNGQTHWSVPFKGSVALPVVDFGGDVIASDGLILVGYTSNGSPFGRAVPLFPVNGQLFDLTIVESKIVLLYKCGFLVTYLTNGIPHASLWLNDTVTGEEGTFIPLASPAAQGDRLFIVAAFRPHNQSLSDTNLYLRLYAIVLSNSSVMRISVAWKFDFTVHNVSLPYLKSNETVCTLLPSPANIVRDSMDEKTIAQVAVANSLVSVLIRYREPDIHCTEDGCRYNTYLYNLSRMLVIEDSGKSYLLRFTGDTVNSFQSLGYSDVSSYWTAFFYVERKQSVLQEHAFPMPSGEMIGEVDIAQLLELESKELIITSRLTFLNARASSYPLVFCMLVEGTQTLLVAVDVWESGGKLLWTVDLDTQQCTGQISTVDGDKDSFLVVPTSSQLLVYNLT